MKKSLRPRSSRLPGKLLGVAALTFCAGISTLASAAEPPIKIGVIAEAQAIAGASIPQAAQ
ncbi:MAG: ABC transporter substrate-binding protein, partial [Burkholderiaceae bacterium]